MWLIKKLAAVFTGIVESTGKVVSLRKEGGNLHLRIESVIGPQLKIDQSVSHNGVCLTVVEVKGNEHTVTAVDETLQKTNLGQLKIGEPVNLERCLKSDGRFDGHIVQGHVDCMGEVKAIREKDGSWEFDFEYPSENNGLLVEKGSITINGVSLTCFNCLSNRFTVAIIPYTYHHTTFSTLREAQKVNLEFDVIGKYVKRMLEGRGVQ